MSRLFSWEVPFSHSSEQTRLITCVFLVLISVAIVLAGAGVYLYRITLGPTSMSPAWQCQHAWETDNPVKAENFCSGTDSWRLDHLTGPTHAVEGFTVPASIDVGETLKIYVSTTAPTYMFQVYRMGWYQGKGGRLVYSSAVLRGVNQPPPTFMPATRTISCSNWHDPVPLTIPTTWVSGVYIVKLLSSVGYMRYTIFVVRNDTNHSPILLQTSVLTYQAYNRWGGYSLYRGLNAKGEDTNTGADRAYVVSFDRPYDRVYGLGDFPLYEYNIVRWAERMGYNTSYTTDVDTDMRGTLLEQHHLFMAVGHDEYWSTFMRNNVTIARDQGVSLAFFGGNDMYWHIRLQNSLLGPDREVICYKHGYYSDNAVDPISSVNPHEVTVLWRDYPLYEPENAVLGEMYGGGVTKPAALVLDTGAQSFLSSTTLHVGSALPMLIDDEYDRIFQNGATPSSLSIIASSPLKCYLSSEACPTGTSKANTTVYTSHSGAKVFDAGTEYWGWGLDDDSIDLQVHHSYSLAAFQRFTVNLLDYLLE